MEVQKNELLSNQHKMLKKMFKTLINKTIKLNNNSEISEFILEPTFFSELNSKSKRLILPVSILAILSWIPFLFIDIELYPKIKLLIPLRLSISLIGIITLVLSFHKILKKYSYHILFSILFAVSFSSGIILGLVKGDPVYMSGYSIVILVTPFVPLKKKHSFIILLSSILIFTIIGFNNEMVFANPKYLYGLFNVFFAFFVSLLAIYFFDKDRKISYGKNYLIQQTNEALENSNIEISSINKELKTVIKQKSEFLHIAAHDLKNPLQVILGYVEILNMEINNNQKSHTKLIKIEKSVEKMIDIISTLLESEEIESGKYKIKKTKVNLNNLLETIINENLVQAKRKKQKICFTNNEVFYNGDPFILIQIFENLISNAIKFSPINSKISILIRENLDNIIISFEDEGPGLTESDKINLFKKFKKLSAKPTGDENSSGLGLSIVKKYVEMHKGKVYAKNNKGHGATFFVELDKNL